MDARSGSYLNTAALLSPLGAVRLLQLLLGCTTLSLVAHGAGYDAPYGTFCVAAWGFCFAASLLVFALDVTQLLPRSLSRFWEELKAALAVLGTLLSAAASIAYGVHVLPSDCPSGQCGGYRIGALVCSSACCLAYAAELRLLRGHNPCYMATPSGVLKVAQGGVACAMFWALASDYSWAGHTPTQYCVVVYGVCFATSVGVVVLALCGRAATAPRRLACLAFLTTLLYLSAGIILPLFSLSGKYLAAWHPAPCPRGRCAWDSRITVTILTYVNLALHMADMVYSLKACLCSRPRTNTPGRLKRTSRAQNFPKKLQVVYHMDPHRRSMPHSSV